MFGTNNPRLVEMQLARRRNMRSRWWKRLQDARKCPRPFEARRLCRHVNMRHKALPQGMKWLNLALWRREI
jgi:hypothetical protein